MKVILRLTSAQMDANAHVNLSECVTPLWLRSFHNNSETRATKAQRILLQ